MNILKLTQQIMTKLGFDTETGTLNIDAEQLKVKDPIIEINTSDQTGVDSGLQASRGAGQDPAKLIFEDASQVWKVGVGSEVKEITTDTLGFDTEMYQLIGGL